MPEYRTFKYGGADISLYARKQANKWVCDFIVDVNVPGLEHRDTADGTFASLKEAEDAAMKKAKKWIDKTTLSL